jgi:hypothetical protein
MRCNGSRRSRKGGYFKIHADYLGWNTAFMQASLQTAI